MRQAEKVIAAFNLERAFPSAVTFVDEAGAREHVVAPGMSLRDYFAAAALTGMLSSSEGCAQAGRLAVTAYHFADAMLAERAKS